MSGLHRSPLHGVSVEFADYREYTPGDDLKRLDWRAYARSNRYYIKRYEEETNFRATLLVDASASMRYGRAAARGEGGFTKFGYAATLAASLAMLCLKQRDAVGLALFDDSERSWLRPSAAQSQLMKILDVLESARPDRTTDLGLVLNKVAAQINARGLVIVVSDLLCDLDALYQGLGRVQRQGHDILIFHVLDKEEIELPFNDSVLFRDIEGSEEIFAEPWAFRQAYRRAMDDFILDVGNRCRGAGIDYTLLDHLRRSWSGFGEIPPPTAEHGGPPDRQNHHLVARTLRLDAARRRGMTFLAGSLLGGLVLASVPIIIHILNRRRFQIIDWPPMKYLKLTLKRNRRRIRIEQMILLAMRTLAVILLILAIARPVIPQNGLAALFPGHGRTSHLIVIDDSLSMGYTTAGRSAFDVARNAAADLLKTAGTPR